MKKSVEPEFDDQLYGFYSRLTSLYPEVEMVPEDCPVIAIARPEGGACHDNGRVRV